MRPVPRRQRGFLLLMAAVLIVIVGFLGVALTYLITADVRSSGDNAEAVRALFLAESGLERGLLSWSQNPGTYVGETNTPFGTGSFTVTVDTDGSNFVALGYTNPLPGNQRHIRSVGTMASGVTRTVDVVISTGGGGGNLQLDNADFNLPIAAVATTPPDQWDMVIPPGATAVGGGTTGHAVTISKGNGGGNISTTVGQNMSQTCTVSAATVFQVNFQYRYFNSGSSGGNNRARMRFRLLGTPGGPSQSNWFNISANTGGYVAGATTVSVNGGKTIDRFEFLMEVRGNTAKQLWVDDIQIFPQTGTGCDGALEIQVWREDFP